MVARKTFYLNTTTKQQTPATTNTDKNRAAIIDEENTIQGNLTADDLRVYIGEYIDNPAQRLEEIAKARATVEEIKKQYNDAAEKCNNLLVEGFEKVEKIYK